jgi:hypothetical protein
MPVRAVGRIELVELAELTELEVAGAASLLPAEPYEIPLGAEKLTTILEVQRATGVAGKVYALPIWTFGAKSAPQSALDAVDSDDTLPLIDDAVSVTPPTNALVTRPVVLDVPPGATGLQWRLKEIGADLDSPSSVALYVTGGH